ncbi:HAMP domain-containing sensor histidine kinase [Paenibacillus qinlingensis]|uniref:histidine kinase n=1 Tax=Paenibacillus qinlingensis TaxID=1837343 RepID=A0ABU1NR51_9BACL|nr:HAMP domain-containing sensor histidine kinase [Paenibacillus qinlingensis]MDR6549963.1 signal transduction histidine kinase [Paenibacillus qinlingensis]
MANLLRSFRSKMIGLLGLSLLMSGTFTFILYRVLKLYYSGVRREDPVAKLRHFVNTIGDLNFFLMVFVPLSILCFFFLTKRYATYFNVISTGIHRLAGGDFHSRIHIDSNDEFKDIADDINMASEKLQQAVARGDFAESSKDQLVLNLAHDLRTPLTSVIGYLDFILQDEQLSREQMIHYTTIAFNKSQRLEKLIDELFEITRMKYGMLSVEKKPINLSELLIQLNEELYPVFEKSNLISRVNLSPHMEISADGELLARVFENLLTNADRYGKDGHFVDINGYLEGEEAVVQVINYGNCIPADELPHLFEMFYTGDQARTHQGGSTGLGLFIAKNIVEQHQGTIAVQSDVIRTLFEVRLPLY